MNVGAVFSEMANLAKSDGKALLPAVGKAALSMAENPTEAGVIAAAVQLIENAVVIVGPQIVQELLPIINGELQSWAQKLEATPAKPA